METTGEVNRLAVVCDKNQMSTYIRYLQQTRRRSEKSGEKF